ncbi:UNVERIFIED_CONTAM: DUF21 domain-containing protein [Sesamum angustifolium]|uniref:DUF21 domain-containing protein n=1 Tax=Sesamum angustifolium TaxID=2727405 RepID=A0AAW2L696_9LAMI
MADDIPCCETKFFLFVLIIIGLVTFAGLMAGLTLGLMSLGLVDLEVLSKSGRPQDRIHASKILPVVKNQHLLLCTLLIGNSLAMESLPIFLGQACAPMGSNSGVSHTHPHILPQAICTRYGLTVGATTAPFVRLLLWLFFPVAYPISKFLDWMLGKGHAALLRRAELKTFVDFHGNEAGKGGDLTHDETTIIAGALDMTEKTAKDAMTPIAKAFSLDLDGTLNLETLNAIMTMGHSRVPVYYKNPNNIIGLILVKNLLAVDPDDSVPLRKMLIRKIPRRDTGAVRFCILDLDTSPIPEFSPDQEVVGVITMEDVIEELLQEEILDETDEYVNIHNRIKINMNASQDKAPQSNSNQPLPPASAPALQSVASKVNSGLAGFKFKLLSSQECAGVVA